MPKPAPSHIASRMPPGWKLWRVDGQIIHSQALQHDKAQPGNLWPGRQFRIGEVDPDSGKTFDATISFWMANYDFSDGDRVSLVGHVPADARQIGSPSFLISHDSGAFCPVGLGLPDSWVVCGGSSAVGGLGMIFKAFKSGSMNADLHGAIWKHIMEGCSTKTGYIYPVYYEFIQFIMSDGGKGPNLRLQQQNADEIDF